MTTPPDSDAVLASLKDFQRATVEHVFRRLWTDQDAVKKFLVADEVGLGKTLVAKGVIAKTVEHLWDEVERIDVVYICSNTQIARQNLSRLNIGGNKLSNADRLTLLPTEIASLGAHKVNFIAFTPGTSFNLRHSGGRWEERRLLYWMLARVWGKKEVQPKRWKRFFEGTADQANFEKRLTGLDLETIDAVTVDSFARRLQSERGPSGAPLAEELHDCVQEFNYLRGKPAPGLSSRRFDLIGRLRGLLAHAAIEALEPDLVIMDEFQRFKDLVTTNDPAGGVENPAAELAHAIFEHPDAKTLMLSATPYKMYTLPDEPEGEDHYEDFTRTVQFLAGADRARAVEKNLRIMRESLLAGEASLDHTLEAKRAAQDELRRVMCRTERLAATPDRDGMLIERDLDGVRLTSSDVRAWRTIDKVADLVDSHDVFEYWRSTPYALNIMDHGSYLLRKGLDAAITRQDPQLAQLLTGANGLLSAADLQAYRPVDPGNAKMRGLFTDVLDRGAWRLLWLPPSLPYYQLGGSYAAPELQTFTKRLVFSAWNVVPKAISVILSYEAERRAVEQAGGSAHAYSERTFTRPLDYKFAKNGTPGRMSIFTLAYPSTVLAAAGDPWRVGQEIGQQPADPDAVYATVRGRIAELLTELPPAADSGNSQRWYWAAPLLLDRHLAVRRQPTFESLLREQGRSSGSEALPAHVEMFLNVDVDELGAMPEDLADVLTLAALASPANVALRALSRVCGGERALIFPQIREYASAIAEGFRGLFNKPDAVTILHGEEGEEHYWRTVLQHAHDGCLQAVLDEYVHVAVESEGLQDTESTARAGRIAEVINEAIGLKTVSNTVDDISVDDRGNIITETHRVRLDLAGRFGSQKTDDATGNRESSVRTAYNSPFRPFVLASTSVGQEGLDFHTYSHAIVHWNLPGNPVDLEQREGRVHRYKGHAVRKNLAAAYGTAALTTTADDPWAAMFEAAAEARPDGETEIAPYWVLPGPAAIERYVPVMPLSREEQRYRQLQRTLGAYRMVIGQPRQDDLLRYLRNTDVDPAALAMDLTPPATIPSLKTSILGGSTGQVPWAGVTSWRERGAHLWNKGGTDGLMPLVDIELDSGPAHPDVFEYAVFNGERWDDVPTMRRLIQRLVYGLWLIDPEKLRDLLYDDWLTEDRPANVVSAQLPNGMYLYVGWQQWWLLDAAKELVVGFGVEDNVEVKLIVRSAVQVGNAQ